MRRDIPGLMRATVVVLAAVAMTLPVVPPRAAGGEAPAASLRPAAKPDPLAERREDWLDWQRDRGGNYRQFLRQRQAAEREARERRRQERRHERLERSSSGRGGERLGERPGGRLGDQGREQSERIEQRTPGQRLRPDTLRRHRPESGR